MLSTASERLQHSIGDNSILAGKLKWKLGRYDGSNLFGPRYINFVRLC